MSNAAIGSASHTNANQSRQPGVSRRSSARKRRQSWIRPFRRTRQAIDRSLRLIEESGRVIEAAERFAARHPRRAARQYERVSGCLEKATAQLACAVRALGTTAGRIALSPSDASDAPPLLLKATIRCAGAAGQLAALSHRLDDTFDLIIDAIGAGTLLDLSRLSGNPIVRAPGVIRLRPRSPRRLSRNTASIRVVHSRRQPSARLTYAEAARRIFRGRAPPLVSTCPL